MYCTCIIVIICSDLKLVILESKYQKKPNVERHSKKQFAIQYQLPQDAIGCQILQNIASFFKIKKLYLTCTAVIAAHQTPIGRGATSKGPKIMSVINIYYGVFLIFIIFLNCLRDLLSLAIMILIWVPSHQGKCRIYKDIQSVVSHYRVTTHQYGDNGVSANMHLCEVGF